MSNPSLHTETTFEQAIVQHLTENGWKLGERDKFHRELALDTEAVLAFVKQTQPNEWKKLASVHGAAVEERFIQRLTKELELRGMLDVLRRGVKDSGVQIQLAYWKPESAKNEDTLRLYAQNNLTVTRQVFFSTKDSKSIDLLLSLNGLPVATLELKNQFTSQTVEDAKAQYKTSRSPGEPLFQFKKRALVHFALDPNEVYLTTKLDGERTRFLPFNKGFNNGKGNPPAKDYATYRTAYFWEEILQPDSWLDILSRFLHLETGPEVVVNGKSHPPKESLIFPRYHQLDAVRCLSLDAKLSGTGRNYLIQHSAGSGKSNTIAWLAYRLSSLYNANDARVFDSVIVVTDRTVLDQQLQNTIYQFDHKQGVVQRIDKDSEQLAEAIHQGVPIVITTLQKFPFALKHLSDRPDKRYAVIIDEAHSSQGGESSRKMTEALSAKTTLEESERIESQIETDEQDAEDEIRETIRRRGPQPNVSVFAFTATPKPKTLEVFGTRDAEGKPRPFHLYAMRQAIEEGFILDVLKNYTTYETYYRFSKRIEDDPELNKRKAAVAIGRFASLHPTNLSQKTEVMVEHFRQVTMKKIGGKAKAMVVTASRKHALRYFLAFKKYIEEKKYTHIKPLVAFSGAVYDDAFPDGITEAQLNGFGEKELPAKFAGDDYRVLLVADKYQTGFDQPLLHTMYVDKKLSGVKAVQTLSRLNRTHPGKEDTFVLDFANERQVILDSFQPYYELTTLTETADPNHLYDLKNRMDAAQVYYQSEVDSFAKVFYKQNASLKDQGRLYGFMNPSVDRYKLLREEQQDDFSNAATTFVRLYSFLSQIMPFQDVDLEKQYTFTRYLLKCLPKSDYTERLKLDNDVALEYYRLQKVAEGNIVLEPQSEYGLSPVTEAGLKKPKDEKAKLSDIITLLNDRFGTDFTDADRLFFDQIEQEMFQDDGLKESARNNPIENFRFAFEDLFDTKLIERMEANQELFEKVMGNDEFGSLVKKWLLEKIYQRFKAEPEAA